MAAQNQTQEQSFVEHPKSEISAIPGRPNYLIAYRRCQHTAPLGHSQQTKGPGLGQPHPPSPHTTPTGSTSAEIRFVGNTASVVKSIAASSVSSLNRQSNFAVVVIGHFLVFKVSAIDGRAESDAGTMLHRQAENLRRPRKNQLSVVDPTHITRNSIRELAAKHTATVAGAAALATPSRDWIDIG